MNALVVSALGYFAAQFNGSMGWAILAVSFVLRGVFLPLTVRLARRARRKQEMVRAMQPELDELKRRHAKNPERLFAEMRQVHQKHGFQPFDLPALLGGFAQWPLFGMLYRGIRACLTTARPFLWIRNLATPDGALTLVVLFLTALGAYWMPGVPAHARVMMIFLQIAVTALIVWKLAAGLGLYWVASSSVSVIQSLWLRRWYAAEAPLAAV